MSCAEEATLVRQVRDGVDQNCANVTPSILPVPDCGIKCIQKHALEDFKPTSHLAYKIGWVNKTCKPFDLLISLHMNAADAPSATGVEVFYSDGAPLVRKRQALAAVAALSDVLGIPNRGIKPSWKSQHPRLGILDDTRCPALLFELGFITNPLDTARVEELGATAVISAIEAIRRVK